MRAAARLLAIAVTVPIAVVLAGFGFLQTRPGQDWLAGAIARAMSGEKPAKVHKIGGRQLA